MARWYLILTTVALTARAWTSPPRPQLNRPVPREVTLSSHDSPPAVPVPRHVVAKFERLGRSGVPAMHAALLQDGRVVFLDKVETYTELKLENGRYAFSSIFDPETHELIPLNVPSNAFCSAGAFLRDGRLISLGGNADLKWLDPTVSDGLDAIRYLDLNVSGEEWIEPGNKLASNRWYATALTMADGSIFVASGSLNSLDLNDKSNNNPTYEVLNQEGVAYGQSIAMDILVRNQPY